MTRVSIFNLLFIGGIAIVLSGCTKFTGLNFMQQKVDNGKAAPANLTFEDESIPDVYPHFLDIKRQPCLLPPDQLPITGTAPASVEDMDDEIRSILRIYDVPGCAVAIVRNGRLVCSRGYGWANIAKHEAVKPDSMFRLASVSKVVTMAAALALCDQKKLSLSTKAFPLLAYPPFPENMGLPDPHLDDIMVLHLLQCTAGWNRDRSGDPLFAPFVQQAAEQLSPSLRAKPVDIIRYWTNTHRLDFLPGTRHVYSNLAYTVLGEVIAKASGQTYEEYVQQKLLQPLGIKSMRLGRTLHAAPREVTYYPFAGQELNRSVFPNYTHPVPLPYGGDFSMEALRSDTGWLASAPALAKFVSAIFGEAKSKLPLSPQMEAVMTARPDLTQWQNAPTYFACAWDVSEGQGKEGLLAVKQGSLAGCMAYVGHRQDGTTVAWLVNSRPILNEQFQDALTSRIWNQVDYRLGTPDGDLFADSE
jgi:CubicO group peptidase (beta-lactamase class C family)